MRIFMKKTAVTFLAVIMALSVLTFSPFETEVKAYGETFIIDPGHGGEDPGACGSNPYREEADDVLLLSMRVGEIVSQYASVTYTRTTDATLSLSQRSSMANAGGHDYIISIHRNAFSNPAANGLEVWWYSGTYGGNPSACQRFATSVYDAVMEQVPVWTERGVKDGNLHMCRQPYMPSCLIETGFITNQNDNAIYDQYFEEIALGIANGMLAMIGKQVTGSVVTTNHILDGNSSIDMGKDFYARIKHPASGKYLADVNGYVNATDLSGGSEQVWHFMRQASGAYLVGNGSTSKFIEVQGASYKDATRLVTNSATFDSNQKFFIYYINNNFYFMPEGGDKTLDINASTLEGQIYGNTTGTEDSTGVASAARQFSLEVLSIYDGTKSISDLGDSFTATIKNTASGKFVTASNGSLIGANESKAENQQWIFTRLPNGAYTIVSVSENTSFDIFERRIADGTSVDLFESHGEFNQAFFLLKTDGTYYIKATYSLNALYMDASSLEFFVCATSDDEAKIAGQKFEISMVNDGEEELVLKNESSFQKDGTDLFGVPSGQSPSKILENFENTQAVVLNGEGAVLDNNLKVGTGCTITLISNGEKVDSVTVIVNGDVTGDGIVDATDYLRIKSTFLKTFSLEGAYEKAADVDSNVLIDATDYLRVKAHFLGTYDLYE